MKFRRSFNALISAIHKSENFLFKHREANEMEHYPETYLIFVLTCYITLSLEHVSHKRSAKIPSCILEKKSLVKFSSMNKESIIAFPKISGQICIFSAVVFALLEQHDDFCHSNIKNSVYFHFHLLFVKIFTHT